MRSWTVALALAALSLPGGLVGQAEGGAVNVSLKSGTNQLHGTALYVKMDPVPEANSFLANNAGQPKGDYSYDRGGAGLSGPIVIPKLYDRHNRSFFLYGSVTGKGQGAVPETGLSDANRGVCYKPGLLQYNDRIARGVCSFRSRGK